MLYACYSPDRKGSIAVYFKGLLGFPVNSPLGVLPLDIINRCRTDWKSGREATLLSQRAQCQMAPSNSACSRDIALPVLLRLGGKKPQRSPSLAPGAAQTMEFHPAITVLWGGKREGYLIYHTNELCTSSVFVGMNISLRKAYNPNLNTSKGKWPAGMDCHCFAREP